MYQECGGLFERAGAWERAAEVYIKGKMWQKVGTLLEKVTSPKVFVQYAKAKEAMQQYAEAATAYERARDFDNVVRVCVEHLQEIDKAVQIVRETRSRESARIVSKFFQARKDYHSVVEFCLMAGMTDEAFELAQQHDVMEHFGELVKGEATPEMLVNISSYFENKHQLLQAGKYCLISGDYVKALRLFTRCPVLDGESVELAIEAVGMAKNDALTHELIDYLMGESDGVPKEAKYIFKLYMSLGSFRDAARTAIIIAREEQTLGNYRAAHDLLLDNCRQLKKNRAPIPAEMERMLMLLHSYILVKTLINKKINAHEKGARMLIRVANNISKFPAHVVPILTSTVIECHRANLKKESFEYAAMLMRPEYRTLLDKKYQRKIEQIVRRPEKDESTEEPMTPCPFCSNRVPETVLDCIECKNHIPYCIATGRHMTIENWCVCPTCNFPALLPDLKDLVEKTGQCPMCAQPLFPEQLKPSPNPLELLRGIAAGSEDQSGKPGAKSPGKKGDANGRASAVTMDGVGVDAAGRNGAALDALGTSLSALESGVPVLPVTAGKGMVAAGPVGVGVGGYGANGGGVPQPVFGNAAVIGGGDGMGKGGIPALQLAISPCSPSELFVNYQLTIMGGSSPAFDYKGAVVPLHQKVGVETVAAISSALLVSPFISIIDKSIFSNASGRQPLMQGITSGLATLVMRPHYFVSQPSFLLIWGVYSGTYIAANQIETFMHHFHQDPFWPKFVGSTLANVGLSVLKDMYFTRAFAAAGPPKSVPMRSMGLYTIRDSMTVFGGFSMPQMISERLVKDYKFEGKRAELASQLITPCAVQLVSTPLHLLGMDLYNKPAASLAQRFQFIAREYVATTLARMGRIFPAYGIGGVVNKELRLRGHQYLADVNSPKRDRPTPSLPFAAGAH
ncbi:WD repeat-containing protein 19 [Irineochytrium annulatum]|nr:WD repeat-containing protein 19 [Irineochytrium annulatum]